jgi:hypothetical protein
MPRSGPDVRAASWTFLPRSSFMASSDSSLCASCKELPADYLGRIHQRRSRNGAAWSPLPLCDRIWCGRCLRLCKPRHSFLDTRRFRFRRSIWRGRLFLHEPHRVTALRRRPSAFFLQVNDRRRRHSHLLRRASHISHRAQTFATTRLLIFMPKLRHRRVHDGSVVLSGGRIVPPCGGLLRRTILFGG